MQKLPHYMVPQVFVELEEIPLTTNGKVDYKQLPKSEVREVYINHRPSSIIEQQLATIWCDL